LVGLLLLVTGRIGGNYAIEIPALVVLTCLTLFVAVRFGILAFIVALIVYELLDRAPLTLELSRWYAARGLFLVALILVFALWAFRVALGGRPAFRPAEI
jgi:hypothetical protein